MSKSRIEASFLADSVVEFIISVILVSDVDSGVSGSEFVNVTSAAFSLKRVLFLGKNVELNKTGGGQTTDAIRIANVNATKSFI